jgi:hypothetical protein
MSRIRLYGDSTGYIEVKGPDVGNNGTLELPNTAVVGQAEFDDLQQEVDDLKNTVSDVEAIAILGF